MWIMNGKLVTDGYSGWRFKEGGTLTTSGDVSEFYYSEYRIKIQVTYYGLSNFGIFEKHWQNDNWQPVNY